MKTPTPEQLVEDTKAMFQHVANYGSGPAYPQQMQWGMTDGVPNTWFAVGLTKRERFAMAAMQGLLSCGSIMPPDDMASKSVEHADALLERLKK